MKALQTVALAAIRRDKNGEWIDHLSISSLRSAVWEKTAQQDKESPSWANGNPVVRVVEVVITERKKGGQ